MPAPRTHPPPSQPHFLGLVFDVFFIMIASHAACITPFTRKHFGERAFSTAGPGAMFCMWFALGLMPPRHMAWFFGAWFCLILFHRRVTLAKRARGWDTHSRDDGIPWLAQAMFRPRPTEDTAKGTLEPLLCLLAGGLLSLASPPLAVFVASSSVSIALKCGIERSIDNRRLRDWKDKEFEMRAMFERYRSGH